MRHSIERALDLPLSEPDPSLGQHQSELKVPHVQGLEAASATVDAWRQPRTLTSLSFIDGYMGRGYVTFKEGGISQSLRDHVNRKYGQFIHVAPPQASSHVWTEASLVSYLSFLGEELRIRRQMLGLTAHDRALIMMDQAGAHMSRTYVKLQEKFCEQYNVETCLFLHIYIYIVI